MVAQYIRGLWIDLDEIFNFSKGAVMFLGNLLMDKSEMCIVIHKHCSKN
jgi:hypothetical protein